MSERSGAGALVLVAVCCCGWALPAQARYETYDWHWYFSDDLATLVAVDGVVGVLHPLGETQRVKNRVQQALPGWRSRSLFAWEGASAENDTFTLFAHPQASAELVGFSGVDDGGPAASEILSQLEDVFADELFFSPLFVPYNDWVYYPSCGYLVPDRLRLRFPEETPENDRLEVIASIGGEVIDAFSFSFGHFYAVRFGGVRSALEILELDIDLQDHPTLYSVEPYFVLDTVLFNGCGGPAGGPVDGGTGGGGGQALAVPTLGPAARIALATLIVVAGALVLGRRRP